VPGATRRLMRAALPPGKGHFYSILNDCHCFVLRPGAVQFLPELAQIFAILVVVLRFFFPCVQQRHQSLDFLKLTRHSFTMFLVVIPLHEAQFKRAVRPARITADIRIEANTLSSQQLRSCFRVLLNASRVSAIASRGSSVNREAKL